MPRPREGKVGKFLELPPELVARVEDRRKRDRKSFTAVVRDALEHYLEAEPGEPDKGGAEAYRKEWKAFLEKAVAARVEDVEQRLSHKTHDVALETCQQFILRHSGVEVTGTGTAAVPPDRTARPAPTLAPDLPDWLLEDVGNARTGRSAQDTPPPESSLAGTAVDGRLVLTDSHVPGQPSSDPVASGTPALEARSRTVGPFWHVVKGPPGAGKSFGTGWLVANGLLTNAHVLAGGPADRESRPTSGEAAHDETGLVDRLRTAAGFGRQAADEFPASVFGRPLGGGGLSGGPVVSPDGQVRGLYRPPAFGLTADGRLFLKSPPSGGGTGDGLDLTLFVNHDRPTCLRFATDGLRLWTDPRDEHSVGHRLPVVPEYLRDLVWLHTAPNPEAGETQPTPEPSPVPPN